jgi:hypothetical protein
METGSKDRYFQDVEDDALKKLVPEGIVSVVPYQRRELNEKYVTIHWRSSVPEWDTVVQKTFLHCKKQGRFVCITKQVESMKVILTMLPLQRSS